MNEKPNTNGNGHVPQPLFSSDLLGEIDDLARDTIRDWLHEVSAPEDVLKLIEGRVWLAHLWATGPENFAPGIPGQYNIELAGCVADLSDLIVGVQIRQFPIPTE